MATRVVLTESAYLEKKGVVMSDAYQEGNEAFAKGAKPDDNPYGENDLHRDRWNEGWEDAKIDQDAKRSSVCGEKK